MHFKVQCPRCEMKFQTEIALPPQQAGGRKRQKDMTKKERSQNAKKGWNKRRKNKP